MWTPYSGFTDPFSGWIPYQLPQSWHVLYPSPFAFVQPVISSPGGCCTQTALEDVAPVIPQSPNGQIHPRAPQAIITPKPAIRAFKSRDPITKIHTHHHFTSHPNYKPSEDLVQTKAQEKPVRSISQLELGHHSKKHRSPKHTQPLRPQGRKKALCIGINYTGQKRELHGCINDAKNVRQFLIKQYHYKPEDIFLLVDDSPHSHQQPTRSNILDGMHWLVRDAGSHDSLFFHYSGHGGQTDDLDGDEVDGLDEVIFPVDYKWTGHILDDDMHRIMVKQLPKGCRLTAVFDSCHSGSALDLPYVYHSDGRLKTHSEVTRSHLREKSTEGIVISWSGCTDSQTSADTWEAGAAVGALSYAFMRSLSDKPNQTYQQLLFSIRGILKKNYSQKLQLSASRRFDTTLKFIV